MQAKLGLEMEMVVAHGETGRSHSVLGYFDALARRKASRGLAPRLKRIGTRVVAVLSEDGESGLDNAFNHLESAMGPVVGGPGGLARLDALMRAELSDVIDALEEEGAVLLNVSEHPDCELDEAFYRATRAPKPIYDYWVGHRGWSHRVGIDAKAQNGPTTSVPLHEAARALNVVLALAPASIALFANSPLEGGRVTGLKENRLSIWPRMFGASRFPCDARLSQLPGQPFAGLGEYFLRAYGDGTVMHTVPFGEARDYKGSPHTARVHGDPSLCSFLAAPRWTGTACGTGAEVTLHPSASHFEHMQFSPFLDARFRFRFGTLPAVADLLAALPEPGRLEALMAEHGTEGYIEGRVPGANFPDAGLVAEIGHDAAASVPMSASAIQAGLMANLGEAERLVRQWGWERLRGLRQPAVARALHDPDVHALAGEVLAVAEQGLDAEDRHRLAYAKWVCRMRRTGADRLLETWEGLQGTPAQRLRGLAAQRTVLHPRHWAASNRAMALT